jgi:hypothetical protein
MARFFKLRHRLALIICPEMGVEARLKAMREEGGFFDLAAARKHGRTRKTEMVAQKEPFLHPDHMAELLADLRHGRLERAKKILMVIHDVKERGVAEEADLLLDRAAQELAVLLFGEA